jgi:hypothetical protein
VPDSADPPAGSPGYLAATLASDIVMKGGVTSGVAYPKVDPSSLSRGEGKPDLPSHHP